MAHKGFKGVSFPSTETFMVMTSETIYITCRNKRYSLKRSSKTKIWYKQLARLSQPGMQNISSNHFRSTHQYIAMASMSQSYVYYVTDIVIK